MTRTDTALAELRAFLSRNENASPVRERFPFGPLELCAEVKELLAADAHESLVALLQIATRYDDHVDGRGRNCYEGNDLRRQSAVVAALARCRRADAESHVAALLRSVIRDRYYAVPGSPDIDKYDRDLEVERSEDRLALSCAEALVRWAPRSADAAAALRAARDHRHQEVRALARSVQDVARFVESPMSRFYDRFNALPFHEWVPRLLSPTKVRELCSADARDADALDRHPWCALVLPSCVLHPACLPHPSRPVESLLEISSEEALAIVYGGGDNTRAFVVTDPGRSRLALGTRLSLVDLERWDDWEIGVARGAPALRSLLLGVRPNRDGASASGFAHVARAFTDANVAPEWMCPTVVPIPGTALDEAKVREHRTALLHAVANQERLAALSVPDAVMGGAQSATQRTFDQLFLVVCQALDARARSAQ